MNIDFTNTGFYYECINCGKQYNAKEIIYLCPDCSAKNTENSPPLGVLKTIYNYPAIRSKISGFGELRNNDYLDLLPVDSILSLPDLRVGKTPLYQLSKIDKNKLPFNVYLKDDSQNPTFSFKDRASSIVSAFAWENDINTIVAASTGNAGSSLAGMCAAHGQQAIIIVPEKAPVGKLSQIVMYGATIIPIKGTYDDAFDLSIKATEAFGWYNRNTAFNPLTIEGKKTVSSELYDQLYLNLPDRIFVPVGDGVILSGVYKGFEDLLKLGIIDKMPVIVAVQSSNSDNLIRNLQTKTFTVKESNTVADSISVDIPRNFYMARDYMLKYQGESISVSDDEILQASGILSRNTGLFAEPAAAAAFAAMLAFQNKNLLEDGSNNVVLLTGSGLKDLNAIKNQVKIPESIKPDLDELKILLP